jgi:trigger factor
MSRVQVPFPARYAKRGDLAASPDRLLFATDAEEDSKVIKNKETELLENSGVRLSITVDKEAIQKEYDALVQEYCKTARLDGFRRGKVPPDILIRRYGPVLIGETTERVLKKSLEQALEGVEQKPITTSLPSVDAGEGLKLGEDFTYKVSYDTYPKIELPEYKGLEFEELEVQIGEEDLERELKALQEQNSVVVDKKIPTVATGDVVNVDYVQLDEAGAEQASTRRQSFVFEVGSGYNLYQFDDQLLGLNAGEDKTIVKEYAADYQIKELAGRKITLKVKVNTVKEKQLPPINDELAQDISDKYKNLEDLKKDIREKLERHAAQRVREHSISQLLDKVAAGATIALPKSMLEHELADEWESFLGRVRSDEKNVLRELSRQDKTKESVLEEWKPAAEKRLRLQLVVAEMARRENIEVSAEEMDSRVKEDAEARNITFEQAKEMMSRNNLMEYIRFDLKNEKLYDLLLASGRRKKGKTVKFLDLTQGNY